MSAFVQMQAMMCLEVSMGRETGCVGGLFFGEDIEG